MHIEKLCSAKKKKVKIEKFKENSNKFIKNLIMFYFPLSYWLTLVFCFNFPYKKKKKISLKSIYDVQKSLTEMVNIPLGSV